MTDQQTAPSVVVPVPTEGPAPAPKKEAGMVRQTARVLLADGRTLTVTLGNPDSIRWEQTAARRWPELLPDTDEAGRMRFKAPLFMQTFLTWAALKRTKQYADTFEKFSEEDALEISVEETEVNPTQPGQSPG